RLQPGHVDDAGDAEAEYDLRDSDPERARTDQLEILLAVALVDLDEPALLVLVAAENLDDPVAGENFLGHLGHVAHGILDAAAVAAEGPVQHVHEDRYERHQECDEDEKPH